MRRLVGSRHTRVRTFCIPPIKQQRMSPAAHAAGTLFATLSDGLLGAMVVADSSSLGCRAQQLCATGVLTASACCQRRPTPGPPALMCSLCWKRVPLCSVLLICHVCSIPCCAGSCSPDTAKRWESSSLLVWESVKDAAYSRCSMRKGEQQQETCRSAAHREALLDGCSGCRPVQDAVPQRNGALLRTSTCILICDHPTFNPSQIRTAAAAAR